MAICPYFKDVGSGLTIEAYCNICSNTVSEEKYKYFCDTYKYEECDYFKNR